MHQPLWGMFTNEISALRDGNNMAENFSAYAVSRGAPFQQMPSVDLVGVTEPVPAVPSNPSYPQVFLADPVELPLDSGEPSSSIFKQISVSSDGMVTCTFPPSPPCKYTRIPIQVLEAASHTVQSEQLEGLVTKEPETSH